MILSKNKSVYSFPNGDMTIEGLKGFLKDRRYEEKPFVRGTYANRYEMTKYFGENCYFTYREAYGPVIVVTSERKIDTALCFYLGLYGKIDSIYMIGKDAKDKGGTIVVEERPGDASEMVKKFFGEK